MRCVVTGVAGFVGSHLAERLVAEGHHVTGVDVFTDYYPRAIKERNLRNLLTSPQFNLIEGDLCTLNLDALLADTEWIFHEAAQAGVRDSWGLGFADYITCNIDATQRLLEAAKGAPFLQRFVYASSSSVYGDADELPVTERTPTRPVSPYGVTKLAAEHLCTLYWRNYQVPTVSLRYFTVYGPRHRPDMAFHKFGKALLLGEPITIYGDSSQTRDFTFVSDVVEANVRAATAPAVEGMVFNIAGGAHVSLRETIDLMRELSGCDTRIEYHPTARGDVRDTRASITLAQTCLGYAPQIPLRVGLQAEIDYLRALYVSDEWVHQRNAVRVPEPVAQYAS